MNKIAIIFFILLFTFKQIIFADTKDDTYINTKNISYDEKKNIVELSDNSKININDTNILIDKGIIDYNKDEIEVFGNFYLYQDLNILSGKDLKGDTKLKNFRANDVSYIYNNDLKIDSNKAERINNNIIFYNNFITPCELDGYFNCPTWSLRIDETKYDIEKDKFTHFDTFLQIADYKVFYIPYFTHYGATAPRQKGFLTPTLEFVIGGNSGLKTPYYLPLNINTDVTITPTWLFDKSYQILENYQLNTVLNQKISGGQTEITIDNIKNKNNSNINTSAKIYTKQVVNKNMILSANGLFTNSISTTRSINNEPVSFEDIYLKIENYNIFNRNDYLKSELATVESFNIHQKEQIPISPSFNYHNTILLNESSLLTNLNYQILYRDSSTAANPKENQILNLNSFLIFNNNIGNINFFNKLSSFNSLNSYKFENNPALNRQENNNNLVFSSDLYVKKYKFTKPRFKIIYFQDIAHSSNILNEDSNSLSFNYINQFSDKRLFGNDLTDNSSRIVYGIENKINLLKKNFNFNLNQSYDFHENSNYANKVNQEDRFSDYALELKTNFNDLKFNIDMRIDENTLSRKEMSYSLNLSNPLNFGLNYNETKKNAYKDLSNDTKSLNVSVKKEINNNFSMSYISNMDLKNNYSPYSDTITLSLFDECSQLDLSYSNDRYNDNYNTVPEEKISIKFSMDYLGFFGYEQKTDLFFEETGNFSSGN